MKIVPILLKILGNKFSYRLGRALYMQARGDVPNDMTINGELMIQKSVIKGSSDDKLVCFDVGANIGDWSAALLSSCQSKPFQLELYVFEPVPSTVNVLRKRLGNIGNIHYESLAMSSSEGKDVIYISGELAGTNSLHSEHPETVTNSISIEKITASQYCLLNGIDTIHLLKCDTEGHDMEVIVGTLPLLREGKIAVLQFEYNHRWIFSRHYLKDVFDAIEGLPYRVGKVCQDHIEVYDKWSPEHERFFEANYVLLKNDVMSWFQIRKCSLDENNALVVGRS
jgi:FkbM family methyltransferase